MHGDFSRLTFSEADNFAAVWHQQGRVPVDSDLNELTSILLDHLRRLTVDVLGPFAAAYPGTAFTIAADAAEPDDLWVETGDYYVHGLRCRLVEQDNPGPTTAARYRHHAGQGATPLPSPPFLVELVAWEQTVSARQRPQLLDPGLGPFRPDTLRTAVRFVLQTTTTRPDASPVTGDETGADISRLYVSHNIDTALPAHRPLLSARAGRPTENGDLTAQLVRRGYRRPESQLYRVEVHTGGAGTGPDQATFTYSRDNASVQFTVLGLARVSAGELTATLANTQDHQLTELESGDWVELRDDSWSPLPEPVPLLQVVQVDRSLNLVVLSCPDGFDPGNDDGSQHPYLIRWDQRFDVVAADNAVAIPTDDATVPQNGWLELEDGLQIRFDRPDAVYRAGDYWLIPARSAAGGLLWPRDATGAPASVPASRPVLLRAPLAVVLSLDATGVRDLRNFGGRVAPLATPAPATATATESGTNTVPDGRFEPAEEPADGAEPMDGDHTIRTRSRRSTTSPGRVAGGTKVRMVRLTVQPYQADPSTLPMPPGWTQDLGSGTYTVGRGVGQAVHLSDTTVSSAHAMIKVGPGGCQVWDTGGPGHATSTNGTWLVRGGQKTKIIESVPLEANDVVMFASVPVYVDFL